MLVAKPTLATRPSATQAEAILILCCLFWGATFAFSKIGLNDISPQLFTALRCGLGAAILIVFAGSRLNFRDTRSVKHGVILGVLLFFGLGLQIIALEYTSASRAGFISYTAALYVPILQFFVLKRLPDLGNILGLFIVIAGLYLMTDPASGGLNTGDVLTAVSAMAYALYIIYLGDFARSDNILLLTTIQLVFAGLLSLLSALLTEKISFTLTFDSAMALIYLVLVGTILCTYLMTRYQKDTTPTRAVLIYALEPLFAMGVALVLLGEMLSLQGWLGASLILLGVVVSQLYSQRMIFRRGAT